MLHTRYMTHITPYTHITPHTHTHTHVHTTNVHTTQAHPLYYIQITHTHTHTTPHTHYTTHIVHHTHTLYARPHTPAHTHTLWTDARTHTHTHTHTYTLTHTHTQFYAHTLLGLCTSIYETNCCLTIVICYNLDWSGWGWWYPVWNCSLKHFILYAEQNHFGCHQAKYKLIYWSCTSCNTSSYSMDMMFKFVCIIYA